MSQEELTTKSERRETPGCVLCLLATFLPLVLFICYMIVGEKLIGPTYVPTFWIGMGFCVAVGAVFLSILQVPAWVRISIILIYCCLYWGFLVVVSIYLAMVISGKAL